MQQPPEKPETVNLRQWMDCYHFTADRALELVRAGADPNTKNRYGVSLLHLLLKKDYFYWAGDFEVLKVYKHAEAIRELVRNHRADVNITDENGIRPIHICLAQNNIPTETVELLLELGADPNTLNSNKEPILHELVHRNYYDLVETLLKKYHANINAPDRYGKTIYELVLNKLHSFSVDRMAMLLISSGANLDMANANGHKLIHILIRWMNRSEEEPDTFYNVENIETLIRDYGVQIDTPDRQGKTGLQYILDTKKADWEQKAMILVRLGANPTTTDSQGTALLTHLVLTNQGNRNTAAIKELTEKFGVSLNDKFYTGKQRIVAELTNYIQPNKISFFSRKNLPDAEKLRTAILSAKDHNEVRTLLMSAKQQLLTKLQTENNAAEVEAKLAKSGYYKGIQQGLCVLEQMTDSHEQPPAPISLN